LAWAHTALNGRGARKIPVTVDASSIALAFRIAKPGVPLYENVLSLFPAIGGESGPANFC
jgi:hypothetical protein